MRPWQIRSVFYPALAVVLGTLAWLSVTVLDLEERRARAQHQRMAAERVRAALWRLDPPLGRFLALEDRMPFFLFGPAGRKEDGTEGHRSAETSQETFDRFVRLRFVVHGPEHVRAVAGTGGPQALERLLERVDPEALRRRVPAPDAGWSWLLDVPEAVAANLRSPQETGDEQQQIGARSWVARQQVTVLNCQVGARPLPEGSPEVTQGTTRAVWTGGELILARNIRAPGGTFVQGTWIDWPALRAWCRSQVADLLPEADLVPAPHDGSRDVLRTLTAMPLALVPGEVPLQEAGGSWSVTLSLVLAWTCALLAAGAVAALLRGVVQLSERRRSFVSTLTHELRTPLTTFRMYAEMLAGGMVTGTAQRREYLERLRTEADRLTHLVENVLAYARLEGQHAGRHKTLVQAADLLERMRDRLAERAGQAGLELQTAVKPDAGGAVLKVDAEAVEQVLFNLVDNAAKYAGADGGPLVLEVSRGPGCLELALRDHGPGVPPREGRRLFRPFTKSDRDAAGGIPGVGLGLALSRRLARSQGGELELDPSADGGARFVLRLPS